MKVESYIKKLEAAGIKTETIRELSDGNLLKVPGIGKCGVHKLRAKFDEPLVQAAPTLSEQIATAIAPILLKRRGVGNSQVRAMARMVAAYFE